MVLIHCIVLFHFPFSLSLPLCRCPICMVDFSVGEHIRLLPCMHFYHMHCIDDWLMRSYSCPTCMERVDVGMRDTLTTSLHSNLRRRRRRRRGSTSSTLSGASLVSVRVNAERCSKERDTNSERFVVPEVYEEQQSTARGSCREGRQGSGVQCDIVPVASDVVEQTARQTENRVSSSVQDVPCNIDQIIQISNFEVDPQSFECLEDPPLSLIEPLSPVVAPCSPPMFEYHFDFPLELPAVHSSNLNDTVRTAQ